MKQEFQVIVNPVAGSKDKQKLLTKAEAFLQERQIPFKTLITKSKGHATDYIKNELSDSCTDLLVIGGDGTLNEVLNGLQPNPKNIPISIIPTGTGNDFIKSIDFPKKLDLQLEVAINGSCLAVDIGRCNERYFLNTMGFGFDGKVVAIMEDRGKRFGGHLAYLYTVLHTITSFNEPLVRFIIDGKQERHERVFLMAINIGTTYGGGFKITPKAKVDDGFFDICLIKEISTVRRYINLPKLQRGTHEGVKEIEMLKSKYLNIDHSPGIIAHLDGEYFGQPPYEVSILPKKQLIRIAKK